MRQRRPLGWTQSVVSTAVVVATHRLAAGRGASRDARAHWTALWTDPPAGGRREHAEIAVGAWYIAGGLFLIGCAVVAIVAGFLDQPAVYVPAFALFAGAVSIWAVQGLRFVCSSRSVRNSIVDRLVAGWPVELLCIVAGTLAVAWFFYG